MSIRPGPLHVFATRRSYTGTFELSTTPEVKQGQATELLEASTVQTPTSTPRSPQAPVPPGLATSRSPSSGREAVAGRSAFLAPSFLLDQLADQSGNSPLASAPTDC